MSARAGGDEGGVDMPLFLADVDSGVRPFAVLVMLWSHSFIFWCSYSSGCAL